MKNVLLAATLVLTASVAVGQYTTSHVKYPVDITSYATSGTNAWKYMPGTPSCLSQPGSMSTGADLSIWCLGSGNHLVYKYNMKTYAWEAQTAMGASVVALAVRSVNNIWALMGSSSCPGQYGVFPWTGTAWGNQNGCLVQLSTGWDGVLTGVNSAHQKFTLPANSNTWNQDAGSWNYASQWGAGIGCAIDTSNQVNVIAPPPAVSPKVTPAIPSGVPVGCAMAYDDNGSIIMAWNSAGKVYMIDMTGISHGWSTIAGQPFAQIGGYQKSYLLGLDTTGKPYHWNVNAMYVASTTSGKFTSCPGIPQLLCHQNTPIHAGYLRTKFSSGHGLNYNAGVQSTLVSPSTNMNLTSYDINPACDPLLGHPDDPECTSDTYGYEHCNQANADLPTNPTQNPDPGGDNESVALSGFVRTNSETGPYPTGWSSETEGAWYGIVNRTYYDACFQVGVTEPTCPLDYTAPFNKVMLQAYHNLAESEAAYDIIVDMMTIAVAGTDMPVIMWQPYSNVNGVITCSGQTRETETFGFIAATPACR